MDCSPPGSSVRGFSRQEYWSGLPFPPAGDLPDPEIESGSPRTARRFFTTEPHGSSSGSRLLCGLSQELAISGECPVRPSERHPGGGLTRPHQGSLEQLGGSWEPLPESSRGPAVACLTLQINPLPPSGFLDSSFSANHPPPRPPTSSPCPLSVETKSP